MTAAKPLSTSDTLTGIAERLREQETYGKATETRLSQVEESLKAVVAKVDNILTAVSAHRSTDLVTILSIVKDGALILGIAATAIIYIASNIHSPTIAVQDHRLNSIEKTLEALNARPSRYSRHYHAPANETSSRTAREEIRPRHEYSLVQRR